MGASLLDTTPPFSQGPTQPSPVGRPRGGIYKDIEATSSKRRPMRTGSEANHVSLRPIVPCNASPAAHPTSRASPISLSHRRSTHLAARLPSSLGRDCTEHRCLSGSQLILRQRLNISFPIRHMSIRLDALLTHTHAATGAGSRVE